MAADRLVIICGAGLSMGEPSNLPSAAQVAEMCYDRYAHILGHEPPEALNNNLEALAEYFVGINQLDTVFIDRVVPWDVFARQPNDGHAAVADFLLCGAAAAAITTNYDMLIERCAADLGAFMTGALDGNAANRSTPYKPLLKPHGCAYIDRRTTVWATSQLDQGVLAERIQNCIQWMRAILLEKDLLIVGFWSDWRYLNRTIADALEGAAPSSITLVAPNDPDDLQQKAPQLWEVAHDDGVIFHHEQAHGEVFFRELRRGYAKAWLNSMLRSSRAAFEAEVPGPIAPHLLKIEEDDLVILYDRRRDAEGVPPSQSSRAKTPPGGEALGLFHLLLKNAGAVEAGVNYELAGRRIRVVNGGNRIISAMRDDFRDAPTVSGSDIVACVGGIDTGQPGNIVRNGKPGDIMRPGNQALWLDFADARAELGI